MSDVSGYYAAYLFCKRYGVIIRRDTFLDRVEIQAPCLGDGPTPISDKVVGQLRHWMAEAEADVGRENVLQAVLQIASENEFDGMRNYFDSLVHDGEKRTGLWLLNKLGAPNSDLNRRNLKRLLVACVARVYKPGCWVNFMPILVGPQRVGKTTFLRMLARKDEYFTDAPVLKLNHQQRQEALRGRFINEVAELCGWRNTTIEALKAFVSMTHDSCRRPFDRVVTDQPRRCMLVGTSNEERPLRDPTGNHRFPILPVGTKGPVELGIIESSIDQIWAESKELYLNGFSLDLPKKLWDESEAALQERMEDDPWRDALASLKGEQVGEEERVCYEQIFAHLGIPIERQTPTIARRVADLMIQVGWTRRMKNYKWQGKAVRGFTRPN